MSQPTMPLTPLERLSGWALAVFCVLTAVFLKIGRAHV